jgi:hypothetical protein
VLIGETDTPEPLPTRYGEPIYGLKGKDDIRTLIGRVGMMPTVIPGREGGQTVTFTDDPAYQKSQKQIDFEKKIASGEVESTGNYEYSSDPREKRSFADRSGAYSSYDPATNLVTIYDPEGNVTQQGPRAGSVLGGALGSLMTGLNQTAANPDFQKAVMLAAIAAGGYAALGGGTAAGAAAGEAAAAGALPQYSVNQAIASGMSPGSMGAQMAASNWAATVPGIASGLPGLTASQLASAYGTGEVGAGLIAGATNPFGGSGSLYDAPPSPLASGYGGPSATALTNEAVASGMSPGSLGAQMAADGALRSEALAAAYGTTGPGSALYDIATLGNANALTNQLAEAGTASNLAKLLGGGGSQPNLSQLAINMLGTQDSGKNPGGFLDPTNLSTGSAQQNASILRDLPQLAFGHGPTVAALGNRTAPQGYKRGGLAGHKPEFITGATGHYVKGKGDGQSDDIPAMLADGEYVFDADTVAALGNGSSDAGAKRLDEMRQAIRKHKRAAPVDKIPPKAKSPLEYLKG